MYGIPIHVTVRFFNDMMQFNPIPALLIIDMQTDFVLEGRPLRVAAARSIVPNIREILDASWAKGLPVSHVMRVHHKDGSDAEMHRRDLFSKQPFAFKGTQGAAVIDELAPREGDYLILTIRMSAFIGTELALTGPAAGAAGLGNVLAGGGTLISFPTLVAMGIPPRNRKCYQYGCPLPGLSRRDTCPERRARGAGPDP